MLPPSSQRKSSQREDFELVLHASHHLKNNPPKGRIPKRWDKNLVQEILPEGRIIDRILLIKGYLHVSTFYSVFVHTTPLPDYKETRTSTSDIRSPTIMTPSCLSVLQYSTLQTNSKG